MPNRLLGLDFGDKTIGVAVSDPLGMMALGVETIRRTDANALKPSLRRLGALIAEYGVATIVLGFPKNMNNTQGERCQKTLAFKARLERTFKGIPVALWDERLSTAGAMRTISNKSAIDEVAAVLILQGYMGSLDRKRQDMTDFDAFEDDGFDAYGFDAHGFNAYDSAITMFDEDGNEIRYQMLASKKVLGNLYMLTEEILDDPADDAVAEVLIFKSIADSETDDEMVFELVDEDHDDFDKAFALFKDDFARFDIELE
jgi:putative Holliday junction resolvase